MAIAVPLQLAGILERRLRIVNGAGAHDHKQPVIGAMQDAMHRTARFECRLGGFLRQRQLAPDLIGRKEFLDLSDAKVVCSLKSVRHYWSRHYYSGPKAKRTLPMPVFPVP